MKRPFQIKLLKWICNLLIIAFALGFLITVYAGISGWKIMIPDLSTMDSESQETIKYTTHQHLGNNLYAYQFSREDGELKESYTITQLDRQYRFSLDQAPLVKAKVRNEELSSHTSRFLGFIQTETNVYDHNKEIPIMASSIAVEVDRNEYKSQVRAYYYFYAFQFLFGVAAFVFLRQFVKGLDDTGFFTEKNASYLLYTSILVIAWPIFKWILGGIIKTDISSGYSLESASLVPSSPDFQFTIFLFGLILLVIAWTFKQGVAIQEEQELTV